MSGKLVILLAVLAGLALGGLSVVYHHGLSRRAIDWWGADNIDLIANAPRVETLKLSRGERAGSDGVTVAGKRYHVVRQNVVTQWPGIDHVRHGLLEDVNFKWENQSPPFGDIEWTYALAFLDGPRRLLVVFNRDGYLARLDRKETLAIAPKATGWREFFAEQEQALETGNGESGNSASRSVIAEPSR
jgi:hypothetical protein